VTLANRNSSLRKTQISRELFPTVSCLGKNLVFRVRDCYLVPWKLNEESISVDDIPARL